ncbi:MAG: ATP-binding protein [Deltaproteobacteria bacterium]|nr:ATP-binding protein [Deltaproteobacteria bacterium]
MTGMGGTLEFSVANDLHGISSAAARIDAFCAAHDLAHGISFDVTLAFDELVTDAIGYGFDDDGEHRIDLALRIEGGTLTVEVADDGRAFDPFQAPEHDLSAPVEERARGGLGIYLVRKTMDAVTYRREDGRNVVTLTKRTAAGEAA